MSYPGKSGFLTRVLVTIVFLLASSAFLTLGTSGCKKPGAGFGEAGFGKDVLATFHGETITVGDFRASVEKLPVKPEEREAALMMLINKKLVYNLAVSEGMLADPAVYSGLESYYIETLPELLRRRVLAETTVSDNELVTAKRALKPAFQVSMVVVPTIDDAEAALAELKKGASFKEVAERRSTVKGETERTVSLDDDLYPVGVRAVLNRMSPGSLSPAMKMDLGYVIFRLNSRVTAEDLWKQQVAQERQQMKEKKAEKEMVKILDRLRSSATIKLDQRKLPNGEVQYYGALVNGVHIIVDPSMFEARTGPHSMHQGMNQETLRYMLNKKINGILFSQEARKRGLEYDPDYQRSLQLEKEKVLSEVYLNKVRGQGDITPQEMQDYYNKNKDKFALGASVRISRILLPTQDEAEAALGELKSGKNFAAVARKRSTDNISRGQGGDVGFVMPSTLKEPVKDAISNMKPGEVSGVLKTDYGYEILKATDRKEGGAPAMSTITGVLRKKALLVKQGERVEAFYKSLHEKADIKINKKLLESLKD